MSSGFIIALVGNTGAGKDTFAQLVTDSFDSMELDQNFNNWIEKNFDEEARYEKSQFIKNIALSSRAAFADKLREICSELFLIDEAILSDAAYKDYGEFPEVACPELLGKTLKTDFTPRQIQREVAESLRKTFPSIWIDPVVRKIKSLPNRNWIITDLRYMDQYEGLLKYTHQVKHKHLFVVRIDRPGKTGDSHISETSFANIPTDYVIANQGSLLDLHTAALTIFQDIHRRFENSQSKVT